jgi:serine/threonine protein kinase
MIGRIIGNRYEIIEKIGGGGMSNVYKAKCNVLNRYVAIKILRDELTQDSEFVEKFKQESLSAASLTHPNIVNIYDTGIEDDIYYIVMEYVKGETLKNYIKRMTRLSEEEAVKISRQVAEALRHAHLNNIVHRDIKPHNILLTEDGTAKVTDFGIARASTSSTINNTSNVIGSVHYFSPEQARGGYVDEKSDIYSLGIVMYEMVTGTLPFDADNHISVAMKQIQEKPVPPSKRVKNVNISKNYEDIIMKCLEKHQSLT